MLFSKTESKMDIGVHTHLDLEQEIYYLKEYIDAERLRIYIKLLVLDDSRMMENTIEDIYKRIKQAFGNKVFLRRISDSRQRWVDDDIEKITEEILDFIRALY